MVAQAAYRRLTTPRGTLQGGDEESAYGLDLTEYIGAVGTVIALAALPGVVRAELLKDDRIASVDLSTAQTTDSAGGVSIEIVIDATLDDDTSTFTLTLSISDVGVSLITIGST